MASWNAIATILSRGMMIVTMMITARILGKADFGVVGIVQSSIALFESVAAFGMGVTAAKHIAEYRINAKYKIPRIVSLTNFTALITGVTFSTVLYLLAPWLAVEYLNNPRLQPYLEISALILGFNTFSSIQMGILVGFQLFKNMALINLIVGLTTLCTVIYGAYFYSIQGVFYGLLSVSATAACLNTGFVIRALIKEKISMRFKITKEEWILLWKFSMPAMLSGLMIAPINWLGASMLVKQEDGLASMGVFSAANQWFSFLLFIPGVLTNTLLPMFSAAAARNDLIELRQKVWKGTKLLLVIVLPMVIAIAYLSPWIMKMYGKDFTEGSLVLLVISGAASFAAAQNLIGNALASINRMWVHTLCNVVWAIVYLFSAMYFIELKLGALALGIAMLVSYFSKLVISYFLFLIFSYSRK